MAYVTVPKDLTHVKSKVLFGPVSYTHLAKADRERRELFAVQAHSCRTEKAEKWLDEQTG